MVITNVSEAKASLSKLLDKVQRGEEVVIAKAGKPVAKLVPYRKKARASLIISGVRW